MPHLFELIHLPSKKDIPHLGLIVVLILGIFMGVYLSLQPQLFNKKAAESGTIDLQFIPDSLEVEAGKVYQTQIAINPKSQRVTALQLNLEYDPTVLTILEVKNEGFLPITLKNQDQFDGNYDLVFGSTIESQAVKPGVVASIKFKVLTNSPGKLSINPTSQASISSKEGNVLSNFPVLDLQTSSSGGDKGAENVQYPNNLLLEKAVLPEASPFVRDFKEASEPKPEIKPERIKPEFSGAYLKQLGSDIFIEPIIALNEVIQRKAGEIISGE